MTGESSHTELGIEGLTKAEPIGAGGSAVVYRAWQERLSRTVAVKVLQAVADDSGLRRFQREAATLGRLSENPGIVTVYDTGLTTARQPYLIMQYCPGGTLRDEMNTRGPMPWREVCAIGASIATVLDEAHQAGILHRDLKPANILIDSRGLYLVADFGIATLAGATVGTSTAWSFTPGYVPPETLAGDAPTPAGDVYSLGATLYALLSGRAPYATDSGETNLLATALRAATEEAEDLRPMGIPDPVATIVEHAMAKDPNDRPSLAVMARRLADLRASRPSDTDTVTAARRSDPPAPSGVARAGSANDAPTVMEDTTAVTAASATAAHGNPRRNGRTIIGVGLVGMLLIIGAVLFWRLRTGGDGSDDDESAAVADRTGEADQSTTGAAAPPPSTEVAATGTEVATTPRSLDDVAAENIPVGPGPWIPMAADGLVWAANGGGAGDELTDSISAIDPETLRQEQQIQVGRFPQTPVVAGGRLWLPERDDASLAVIDLDRREVVDRIVVGRSPRIPAVSAGHVWVPNAGDDSVSVVSVDEQREVARIPVGENPLTPAVSESFVWVPNAGESSVTVIDAARREVIDTLTVGGGPPTPLIAGQRVWVPSEFGGELHVFDLASRELLEVLTLGDAPRTPVEAAGFIWVPLRDQNEVVGIDAESLELVHRIPTGPMPLSAAASGGLVFVPNSGGTTTTVIDAEQGTMVATLDVEDGPVTPLVALGHVWIPNQGSDTVSAILLSDLEAALG